MTKKKGSANKLTINYIVIFLVGIIVGFLACSWGNAPVMAPNSAVPKNELLVNTSLSADPYSTFTRDFVLIRFNEYRLAHGLSQAPMNLGLNDAADKRAAQVCEDRKVDHTKFEDMVRNGSVPTNTTEIIAFGEGSPKGTVDAWDKSPTHRNAMLTKDIDSIGVGVKSDCVSILIHWNK